MSNVQLQTVILTSALGQRRS